MTQRRTTLLLGLTALGMLAACSPQRSSSNDRHSVASASDPATNLAQRVRVLGPDAFTIDDTHIRLVGVYGPQGVPDSRCWAEALANKQATASVRAMVAAGRSIRFEKTGGVDEFNRSYAKVFLNGADLGDVLYDEGMVAHAPPGERFNWCAPFSSGASGGPDVIRSLMDPGG